MTDLDCARALELMLAAADGAAASAECEWLEAHVDGCSECRAARLRLAAVEVELADWGAALPAGPDAREELAAKLAPRRPVRRIAGWTAVAATIANEVTGRKPPNQPLPM